MSTKSTVLELLVSATQGAVSYWEEGRKERVITLFQEIAKFAILFGGAVDQVRSTSLKRAGGELWECLK
jgi:hypothetical protein